jgi:hypothetical protein
LQGQLDAINRQITNIVDAIKTSGRFSQAMNQAPADLEAQRKTVRHASYKAENRVNQRIGAEKLAKRIMAYLEPQKQMTLELADLSPLISRVNCGGRSLTLEKNMPNHILPFVAKRIIALKRPCVHYRANAA